LLLVIATVHLVYLTNVGERQAADDPHTKQWDTYTVVLPYGPIQSYILGKYAYFNICYDVN